MTVVDAAMNSASTVDSETVDYFFELHEIVPLSNNTTKPGIDFLSVQSPA